MGSASLEEDPKMPNRPDIQGPGGGRPSPSEGGGRAGSGEGRAFGDPGFRAEDRRLTTDIARYRTRFGPAHVDYGHDQNYRPGYHEGGTRFGFFGGGAEQGVDRDQEFDPDYLNWRDQQMQRHDRDYLDWRREQRQKYDNDYWRFRAERRDDFHQRFQDWRAQRDAEVAAKAEDKD
jgi:hypothetical protein